ncbi:hypothetical protein S40288_07606 [Stachybotrys chartarum IBT 40288]|nr:hypothetical protein S40288_07606 [Stachybotrys chartarum IBT 40288]
MKDKEVFARLKERLKSTESTLQGIVALEQLRVSRMMYDLILKQSSTMEKIERGELLGQNVINMAVVSHSNTQSAEPMVEAKLSELHPIVKQSTQVLSRPTKLLPRGAKFSQLGFSAQIVSLPKGKHTRYRAAVQISLLGKMYFVQLQTSWPTFSFDQMIKVRNIVPNDSAMAVACRMGDFEGARRLLESGLAHGSDVAASGWPMLDYAIESGSARLVRLLLEHGAEPDVEYGEHNMTALQSSFLRGRLDIARVLLSKGADIEHVDSDGYSVLSYLWVVDKRLDESTDFMRLCLTHDFSEVNSCDSRGWTALHRAAAVGTPEDIETLLKLGASLSLRAEWYGWTALFFAASHDNVKTFQTIVQHSGADVYESLDGDGWNLLHCCTYFGAPRVMQILLQSGVDVNQKTLPAPLPEDPELSYRELTASDIAIYVGPNRYQMFIDALVVAGRDMDLEGGDDMFWDAMDSARAENTVDCINEGISKPIYGAEDVDDDKWTLLHWASYNGSAKVKKLLLLKGADPEHLDAISLENNPTVLPTSPFDRR